MFNKEYIFEGKNTRQWRIYKRIIFYFSALFLLYLAAAIALIMYAQILSEKTDLTQADLIIIFTGGKGRLGSALQMISPLREKKIFITGVYPLNTSEYILNKLQLTTIDSNFVDIDYYAKNTVENVLYSLKYIGEHKYFQNIVIISSDYHLARIKMIVDFLKDKELSIQYMAIATDLRQWSNCKNLLRELYKYLRTILFLLFWPLDAP